MHMGAQHPRSDTSRTQRACVMIVSDSAELLIIFVGEELKSDDDLNVVVDVPAHVPPGRIDPLVIEGVELFLNRAFLS